MKLRRWFLFAILVGPAMGGSIIDVSLDTSVMVQTGDTLAFHIYTWNFARNAAAFGISSNPTELSFALVSAPVSGAGAFAATLESEDRTLSTAFGTLLFAPGNFQGSAYSGEVSTLQGYLHLAPLLSETLFSASSVWIVLRNQGPDATLGLDPYELHQSLLASVSGGGLSVGVIPGEVELERPQSLTHFARLPTPVLLNTVPEVPEPRSGGLLVVGGLLLCGVSAALARLSGRERNPATTRKIEEKSTICIL